MAITESWFKQDLKEPVKRRYIIGNFFSLDNVGNLVGVNVYDNGAEATLSGSVTGYCALADGTTVPVIGTRSGNQAYILLPQSVLSIPGYIGIVLKLTDGNTITTLLNIIATVYPSQTDEVITPSSQVITDWSQQIDAALQNVVDASAAQDQKIADFESAIQSDNAQIGLFNLADGYGEATNRGITVKKNNGKICLNGTATGNIRFKISGNIAYAVSDQSAWAGETLPIISGHKYRIIATVLSGTFTPSSSPQDKTVIIRNTSGSTTAFVKYIESDDGILPKDSVFSDDWFTASATNCSYVLIPCLSGETYNNLVLSVRLIDYTYWETYENFRQQIFRRDKEEATGITDILETFSEVTFRGVTLSKNKDVDTDGLLLLNGTAEADLRVKVSKVMAAVPVTIPDTWAAERLPVVSGHIYCLYAHCVSGSHYNANNQKLQFTICGSEKESIAWCTENYQAGDMIVSKTFHADGDNAAYLQATIRSGSVFNNCKIRVGLIDLTVGNAYINVFNEGDMLERKINSVIPFTDMWHYSEITVVSGIYTNADGDDTTYYLATVPLKDSKGNIIPIMAEWDETRSPMIHAQQEKTSLTADSGMTVSGANGAVIRDGVVVHESGYTTYKDFLVYVGFDENRQAHEYAVRTSAQSMISAGIKNACIAYYRLVTNGAVRDVSDIGLPESNLNMNPRMAMFTKADGSVCFLACDGRKAEESGLTPAELGSLMVSLGAVDGWNLDGGGSTSLSVNGVKQNKHIDGSGTVDRLIHVTWNVPGIRPDYLLPECEESTNGTYQLKCTVANGEKTYEWVSV